MTVVRNHTITFALVLASFLIGSLKMVTPVTSLRTRNKQGIGVV